MEFCGKKILVFGTGISGIDAVMQEEIFGPVLPILTYHSQEELIDLLNSKMHPLAAYYFS